MALIENCSKMRRSVWRISLLLLVVSVTAILCLYGQTARSMAETWLFSPTYSHGLLVLPISLSLIWVSRRRVVSLLPAVEPRLLPLLVVVTFIWMLGKLADVLFVQELALVASICLLVLLLLGREVARELRFPLGLLFLAVPAGDSLIPLLQDFTAHFAVKALEISRVPVVQEGRIISIPGSTWEVAEACSGIRFFISSVTMGVVYARVMYRRWMRRFLFILASGLVPIAANGLRVYVTVLLGYLSNSRIAAGFDHLVYGWFFFVLVIFILFTLGWRWREPTDLGSPRGSALLAHEGHPARGNPFESALVSPTKRVGLTAAGAFLLLSLGPVGAHYFSEPGKVSFSTISLPSVALPWRLTAEDAEDWTPHFQGADQVLRQTYTSGPQRVQLVIGFFNRQGPGKKLLNPLNTLTGTGWVEIDDGKTTAEIGDESVSIRETAIVSLRGRGKRLVWSWYWVGGKFTSSALETKLLQLKANFGDARREGAVIALSADYSLDPGAAAEALKGFLQHTMMRETFRTLAGGTQEPARDQLGAIRDQAAP